MITATVMIPEGIKIEEKKVFSVEDFLMLLYINRDDVEDFLDVKKSMNNKKNKFYNFDDIVNEY